MKRITQLAAAFCFGILGAQAQTSSCSDVVAYVSSRNVGSIGNFHLSLGHEEKAAQTYHYSGPGKINSIRVYGNVSSTGGVPLRVHVYTVDQLGRPKQEISSSDDVFWSSDNAQGFISVELPDGGTYIEENFAIGVTVRNAWPYGTEFYLSYTGDGEGLNQDLASVAGTSTGDNWTSAITNFDKDGDFYLVPEMTHFLSPSISGVTHCISVGSPIQFQNTSAFTKDSMFNRIVASDYSGTAHLNSWNFGDGSLLSNAEAPSHSYTTAGAYTATLTIAVEGWTGVCTNSYQFPVSVGLSSIVTNVLDVTCYGDQNGSVSASSAGGTTPYLYSLDGFHYQSLNTFSSLPGGSDTLIVKDALGCLNTSVFTVAEPSQIHLSTISTTNANCGASDGAILVTAAGGTGSLMYKLGNGAYQSEGSFSSLAGGSYLISIKDANGCVESTRINVNNFGSPALSLVSKTNVSCNGSSDGTIQLAAVGGTGVHQFSIDGGTSFQATGAFSGLTAGVYAVLVRDAAGCSQGFNVTINEALPIIFDAESVTPSCFGTSDASLTIHSVTGGIGSFTYSLGGQSYQSGNQFQNLTAGTYAIHVKDAAGCVATNEFTIASTPVILSSATTDAASCNGSTDGSILISATGGNGNFSYSLNNGNFQPLASFQGLSAGSYVYTVRDEKGCVDQHTIAVSQPTQIQASLSSTSATCGVNNGGILAIASGGSGSGYTYSIDGSTFNSTGIFNALNAGTYFISVKDGASCERIFSKSVADANGPVINTLNATDVGCHGGSDGSVSISNVTGGTGTLLYSINGQNWSSSSLFAGLSAGDYTVFVKDVNGCIGTETIALIEPDAFVITKNVQDVTCHGGTNGTITVFAAGGSGALAYSIDNGSTYQSSSTFSALMAGLYKVTVRDVAGCTGSIFVTVHEPSSISFTTGVLNVTCHGASDGTITINANGGTGALQYSIGGVSYQTSTVFDGLSGGLYSIFVKDANNCASIHFVTVHEPDSLELHANIFDVSCAGGNNGAIDISVTGGSGNNTYLWSDDSTTADRFDLNSGQYDLEVTDQNGCTTIQSFDVTEPDFPLVINAVITNTDASTGAIDATVTGGTVPYSFEWGNSEVTEDIDSLTPGNYTLVVTDASGCISSGQFTVENSAGITNVADASDEFMVYPNPASHMIHVVWNNKQIGQLEITDVNGRKVYEARIDKSNLDLDVRLFEEGVYYIRVYSKNETATSRFRVIK